MQTPDPLPIDVLKYLGRTRRADADVQTLLWEVKRLHGLVLRMHQLYPVFPRPACTLGLVHDELARLISDEPCVVERHARTLELIYPEGPQRKTSPKKAAG